MIIKFFTPFGEMFNSEATFVVVHDNANGEFGILPSHMPIITLIKDGYIRVDNKEDVHYLVVSNAIVSDEDDYVKVIAEEISISSDLENAKEDLIKLRKKRIEENRQRNIDLALAEKKLKEEIKKTGAGSL